MAALSIQVPYPVFYDRDGLPLDSGHIYIGEANLDPITNPLATYYDEALTIPAAQPLITSAGYIYRNGTPAQIYVDAVNFSILVNDNKNTLVYSFPDGTGVNQANASDIEYDPPLTGALTSGYTVADKLSQCVSVKDFGAVGDNVTDDTAAIQAAINTGKSIFFPEGFYRASGLTVSQAGQVLFATGNTRIFKNANGTIVTVSASFAEFNGLIFDGSGYTGHNIVATGNNFRLINCSSRQAAGRAVLATGNRTQIVGTNDIYQTSDATATGYDIELGIAGVATLYHVITGTYSSQSTGGILMVATGTSVISSSQFGKLTLNAGGAPAGSGAPAVIGNRINGETVISQTGGRYSCNAFNTNITVTPSFEFGYFGPDNSINISAVITGTLPNVMMNPTQQLLMYRPGFVGSISFLRQPTDNVNQFGDNNNNYSIISSGVNGTYFNISGSSVAQIHSGGFRPQSDGTLNLGGSSQRWNTLYATNGTINTSDRRVKQQSRALSEAERAVAIRCKALVRAFKLNDAVAAKGDAARWHFGVIAQDVAAAFASEGLNAADYGLFCHDEWEAQPEHHDDAGNILVPAVEAGERYGIRYDELAMFILGAI